MKVCAIFETIDYAELAARRVREAGITTGRRRITDLTRRDPMGRRLPADVFCFPGAAEFYPGTNVPRSAMTPAMPFYPIAGRIRDDVPAAGEARLELEVAEEVCGTVCDLLRSLHGMGIHSYR